MGDVETRSVGSRSSGKSGRRYRVVSNSSSVDEALFGGAKNGSGKAGSSSGRAAPVETVRADKVSAGSTIVTEGDLEAIRKRAVMRTAAEEAADRAGAERERAERQRVARERKQRMLQMEEDARLKVKQSDVEIEQLAREQLTREVAAEKLDQDNDVYKTLQSLGTRAAAFTIRDAQLSEKCQREAAEKEYDSRMDMAMELDRLRDLQRRELVEKAKSERRIADRRIIMEQIEDRRRAKLLALEARQQENQAMLAVIKRYEEEDAAAAEQRAAEVRRARQEVLEANERFIAAKEHAKLAEKLELENILAYQAQKDAEMAAREAAEAEKERLFKERQSALLTSQQRDLDKRAQLDELRARRAAEEKERNARAREREALEKVKRDMIALQKERQHQAQLKGAQLAREAQLEEADYEAAVKFNETMAERERRENQVKHDLAMGHRKAILQQITEAEARRKGERQGRFEEGRRLKQQYAVERAKLEHTRDTMVSDMASKGFNPKYLAEIRAVDIGKLHMT